MQLPSSELQTLLRNLSIISNAAAGLERRNVSPEETTYYRSSLQEAVDRIKQQFDVTP